MNAISSPRAGASPLQSRIGSAMTARAQVGYFAVISARSALSPVAASAVAGGVDGRVVADHHQPLGALGLIDDDVGVSTLRAVERRNDPHLRRIRHVLQDARQRLPSPPCGDTRMRSGTPASTIARPINRASRMPRGASGRSRSLPPGTGGIALAWRRSIRCFMGVPRNEKAPARGSRAPTDLPPRYGALKLSSVFLIQPVLVVVCT